MLTPELACGGDFSFPWRPAWFSVVWFFQAEFKKANKVLLFCLTVFKKGGLVPIASRKL